MINPEEIRNIAEHEEEHWWYRGMRRISFGLLDPLARDLSAGRVFEGGCGTGHFAAQVAGRYGVVVHGADLDAGAAELSNEIPGFNCVVADVRSVPYGDESFDLALLMDVLAHMREGEERLPLAEIFRVLRPGGRLFLRTAALKMFRSRHSEFIWERQRFSKRGLCRAVSAEGFSIERATYANSLLSPVALMRFRVWEPLMRTAPASGVQRLPAWMEWLFYRALCVEGRLLEAGFNFPFGQSLFVVAVKPPANRAG